MANIWSDKQELHQAFMRVKANKGNHGIDGMKVDERLEYPKKMVKNLGN